MATLTESDLSAIEANLKHVTNRIRSTYDSSPIESRSSHPIRLVAVSKTKPISAILAAYRVGQRHFGENYLEELVMKSNDPAIISECDEIRWHFIGHLQSNKISKLVTSVPRLFCVETVDSEKCAKKLDATVNEKRGGSTTDDSALKVMVQVNTSGESQKSGLSPDQAVELATLIEKECPSLRFLGFMTIGSLEQSAQGENMDFARLIETRAAYCRMHSIADEKSVELSMGMSGDFETAIKMGSTNVRVGSTIFGERAAPAPK